MKKEYKIDQPLIIFKVDIKRNDTVSTQIEYEVYNPINLEKLNLSLCQKTKINVYPPIELDENVLKLAKHLKEQGYDLFDSSDDFYNDICTPFNSFNNTDVILKDRKTDFYISKISFCEDACEYESFDLDILKANCKCNIKTEIKPENKVNFEPNKIIENFYKIEKYANIKVATCYKQVFDLNLIKKNIGSYILIIIGSIFIILMIFNISTLNKKIMYFITKIIKENKSLFNNLNKIEK